jgi:hypothetical protein
MLRAAISALALLCLAPSAQADSIDGAWCGADGKQLSINGPTITLPNGKTVTGQYRRHEFAYQVPVGETNAGQLIYMQLFTEEDMASFTVEGEKLGAAIPWHRCPAAAPKTS